MARAAVFIYGLLCYAVFFLTFLYAIGFTGNFVVPRSVDAGGPLAPWSRAVLVNAVLLSLFALQHSVMARPGFKRRWTRLVPPPAERSTYVLLSSLLLALLFWQWRPMGAVAWDAEHTAGRLALQALFWGGWFTVLASTFMIDHFELFGLRPVWRHFRAEAPESPSFRTPALYRLVRHPIMLGFLVAFWAAPRMTAGHLLFAAATSGYIFVGVALEERDLIRAFGEQYARYRERVSMILPLPKRKK